MTLNTYKLVIEYDGKKFFGSQKQPKLRTVETVLQQKIEKILNTKVNLMFASRTDSGVHCWYNVVRLQGNFKISNLKNFLSRLNFLLPKDIQVREIKKVENSFNPRKDVKYKIYQYFIFPGGKLGGYPTIFKDYVWYVKHKLSLNKIRNAIKIIKQQKDFKFVTTKDYVENKKSTVCKIKDIKVSYWNNFLVFVFKGNRFLHKMLRNIVGLLVEVGRGKISLAHLKEIVNTWQYYKSNSAPAKGLFLTKIVY